MVDKVILGTGMKKGLDFEEEFLQEKPDILAVTEDDLYSRAFRTMESSTAKAASRSMREVAKSTRSSSSGSGGGFSRGSSGGGGSRGGGGAF